MTPEQQRIAIAEACGWRDVRRDADAFHRLCGVKPGTDLRYGVPGYPFSLDAMAVAEKTLPAHQSDAYFRRIVAWSDAAQRAEAFLKTIGKWV